MRVYTFSEARQELAEVLDVARTEDVVIERRGGEAFILSYRRQAGSPLDIPTVDRGSVTSTDIVEAVREARAARGQSGRRRHP